MYYVYQSYNAYINLILITLQCLDQFVGNGVICGKDSDGDGYPDMLLDCDDPQCAQVRQ